MRKCFVLLTIIIINYLIDDTLMYYKGLDTVICYLSTNMQL